MSFDPLVSSPGRLRILAALAAESRQPFVQLRRATGLTDGNLATHARRLQSAGLVAIEKSIHSGKPLTILHLTREGRDALTAHARQLEAALSTPPPVRISDPPTAPAEAAILSPEIDTSPDDDWVD
jgi:DNA-binding MarR family transcriptional regulator